MRPLFWIALPGDIPLPCLDQEPDGTPREPDGIRYFDLAGAARQCGKSEESLQKVFDNYLRDQIGILDERSTVEGEPAPIEPGALRVVPIEEESRPEPIDLSSLTAEQVRDAIRRRMAGIRPEHYAEFEIQMKDMGYEIIRRECYPVVQWNPDLKKDEVFCCATLAAVEQKVLSSGLSDGWVGPTLFAGPDGELKPIWTGEEPPTFCQVSLRRKGVAEPTVILLDWNEAAQYIMDASGKKRTRTLTSFWRERPKMALEKCAKMKAMRTAFRDVVGTVYIREELPELAARHQSGMERSTTMAAMRHLPRLATGHRAGPDEPTPESIDNETDLRVFIKSRWFLPDIAIDRAIRQARQTCETLETDNPQGFWQALLQTLAQRYNLKYTG